MAAKSLDSDLISPHFYLSAPSGYNEPKIQSLMDLERARPNDPTVKARLKIEKYLSLAVISSHRTSFIRRISALADGSFLGSYHPFTALQTSSGPSEPSRIDPFDDTQVTSVVIYNQFNDAFRFFCIFSQPSWMITFLRKMQTILGHFLQTFLFP